MPEAVCCPKCWTWDELGKRTACKQCGTPLILADGRTVTEAATQGSVAPLVPVFAGNAPAYPMVRITRAALDWVDIARFVTIGYGVFVTVALIFLSFALPHINVPIADPKTGLTTVQTVNLGPAFAIAAVILAGVFALFAWLTRFLIARIIFLGFDGLAILSALAHLGAGQTVSWASAVDLMIDLGYGAVLFMSVVAPRAGFRSNH